MALSRTKSFVLTSLVIVETVLVVVLQSKILSREPRMVPTSAQMRKRDILLQGKESKWKRCKILISGKVNTSYIPIKRNDSEIVNIYKPHEDCNHVLHTRFAHPYATKEEKKLPIAYGFTIHKSASLFERILQAIYIPHNVYCIHIDKKSPEVFYRAIQAIIRCLPNVFIASKRVDVVWGHISLVQAQLECMRELLESTVKWKYYISLIGQDFPLYENKEIVRALRMLNNTNSIDSFPMPERSKHRFQKAYVLVHSNSKSRLRRTAIKKSSPPHNITIYKGSTHIVAVRDFVRFVLFSQIGKDFIEFLKDTFIPDEVIYASLQRHPLAPGGIPGEQPSKIARALHWFNNKKRLCHGIWVRDLCWIQLKDLQWVLGEEKKNRLFVHKIPFEFPEALIECILVARKGRKYGTSLWKLGKNRNKLRKEKRVGQH